MGPHMPDVRALVPRTPPEGLWEWTVQRYHEQLKRGGLVYEVAYAEDWDLLQVLDERARPKKIKVVRAKCSVCGESALLNWGRDQKYGYGFIHPEDIEGDWEKTATVAGDDTTCPICGAPVLVNKAAAVGGGYYVTAECSVMSASLVGEENLLALTGWTVQKRVYRLGASILKFIPAEAYVFSADDCAQLMGWRNSYSGKCGYFISYSQDWRQPARWSEKWGAIDTIYGLTPELIERSCLPHCKLDEYMKPSMGTKRYPVIYLRLYQNLPNVEHVLIHGLPRVLHGLIGRKATHPDWRNNGWGLMGLPELDWDASRPAQILRLTKDELRLAQSQDWGLLFWNLFVQAKAHGETLTEKDIENAFLLGDENVAELAGRGPVAKSIRYLLHQCAAGDLEDEDEDPAPDGIPDVSTLLDYWSMSQTLGRDLNDPAVRFPPDLIDAHDRMAAQVQHMKDRDLASLFRLRRRALRKYSFAADGLLIRPAASQRELVAEGDALHHCVGTYARKHASGKTAIFFIRRASRPKESYFTLELNETTLTVRQNRGLRNCAPPEDVTAFVKTWLAWVHAGSPRDQEGRAIVAIASVA